MDVRVKAQKLFENLDNVNNDTADEFAEVISVITLYLHETLSFSVFLESMKAVDGFQIQ